MVYVLLYVLLLHYTYVPIQSVQYTEPEEHHAFDEKCKIKSDSGNKNVEFS
jgi:hypothetical protein